MRQFTKTDWIRLSGGTFCRLLLMKTAAHKKQHQCHGNDEKDVDYFGSGQEFVEVIHCFGCAPTREQDPGTL